VVWGRGISTPPTTLNNGNSKDSIIGTSYVIPGLTNNDAYNVWVQGKKADNSYTDYSTMQTATPAVSDAAPVKPVIDAKATDDGEIEISWEAARGATNYIVRVGLFPSIVDSKIVSGGADLPSTTLKFTTGSTAAASVATLVGVGSTYYVWVTAKNTNPNPDLTADSDSKEVTVEEAPADADAFENTTWVSGLTRYEFKANRGVVYIGKIPAESDQGTYTYNKPDLNFTLDTRGRVGPITVKGKTFKEGGGDVTYTRQ
jgi:hypothetical protein